MKSLITGICLMAASIPFAIAEQMPVFELSIENHLFQPTQLTVPAGVKIKLLVTNKDNTPEEFESDTLHREKIIPGGKQAVIYIGPLKAGEYPFVGEFNEDTAKGVIIAQ